jgi:hypothetical protein
MVECGAKRFRRPSAGAPKLLRQTRNWAGAEKRVLVATKPVDFRKQADGCAGGARRRSVLRGGLRVSLQEDGSHQACLVGWHRHAARKWAVQVAADRGRADESRLLARRAPRRRPSECCSVSTQHIDSGLRSMLHTEASRHLVPSFSAARYRRSQGNRTLFLALFTFRGISTTSLPAQGEQRRSS